MYIIYIYQDLVLGVIHIYVAQFHFNKHESRFLSLEISYHDFCPCNLMDFGWYVCTQRNVMQCNVLYCKCTVNVLSLYCYISPCYFLLVLTAFYGKIMVPANVAKFWLRTSNNAYGRQKTRFTANVSKQTQHLIHRDDIQLRTFFSCC